MADVTARALRRAAADRLMDLDQPALTFVAFVAELPAWVDWWNREHVIDEAEIPTERVF
ncbi:hypothetical protein ACIRRA_44315 [Nocardia sp. NPDC101769]|uniref:hypothetical protein n=1 Tax=Nocardia sp. NPDC101769 TaxID=3364333 RepID=UPI0038036761